MAPIYSGDKKGNKANVKLCETGGAGVGACWCHGKVMLNLSVHVCLLPSKGLNVQADVLKHAFFTYACVHVRMCVCVCNYQIHHETLPISQQSQHKKSTHIHTHTHTQVSQGLILNAWGKEGV